MKIKNILITGGAGFVGSALIDRLCKRKGDINITSVDNYSAGSVENHVDDPRVRYVELDTKNIDQLDLSSPDVVFHFGEYSRIVPSFKHVDTCWEYNIEGTKAVIDYCLKNKCKLIYSASSSKFGNDGADENLSPYAWMKAKMVELIKNYSEWFGLKYEIVYFYNVYGPGQVCEGDYATVIGIFENQMKRDEPLTVVTPGTQSRDFTHIDDIVSGVLLAASKGKQKEYALGKGEPYTILQVVDMFDHEHVMVPARRGERVDGKASNELARSELGWEPKHSLHDYINHLKDTHE
jgi:UDP-glucose 4-epimerase